MLVGDTETPAMPQVFPACQKMCLWDNRTVIDNRQATAMIPARPGPALRRVTARGEGNSTQSGAVWVLRSKSSA